MRKRCLILLQIILFAVLISLPAFAAPTIDGNMNDNEWKGFQAEEDWVRESDGFVGTGYGGQDFDVEKIGLYVNDSTLFLGLQTGFNLKSNKVNGIKGGDFALDFDSDGSFEFGFRYQINNNSTRVELFSVDSWKEPTLFPDSAPWRMKKGKSLLSTDSDKMFAGYGKTTSSNGDEHYTLELAVDLDILTDKLETLYGSDYSFGNVKAHWTMQCGNDILETTYSQTPEPATLLLFGMGLLGAGAYGRKRVKKEGK